MASDTIAGIKTYLMAVSINSYRDRLRNKEFYSRVTADSLLIMHLIFKTHKTTREYTLYQSYQDFIAFFLLTYEEHLQSIIRRMEGESKERKEEIGKVLIQLMKSYNEAKTLVELLRIRLDDYKPLKE